MSIKDKIRAATLGRSRGFRIKLVEVAELGEDGKPLQVEVREPTVAAHARILREAGIAGGDVSRIDHARMKAAAVIECCFVPGSTEHVFDDTDFAAFLELPVGGWLDRLSEAALGFLNVDEGAVAKN